MTKIKNRTVLITGGASGIGYLLAERCLKEKAYKVILWDIDKIKLRDAQYALADEGYEVATYVVDVSNKEQVATVAEQVLEELGTVDIVFNNAGIVVGKAFEEHSHAEIQRTIDINIAGVMHVARAFLPDMIRQDEGHLINIASAAGLIPNPKMSVYAGSKWAVVGWSESLRLELEEVSEYLKVTTVTPSYINTGMFDGVKAPLLTPIMDPDFIVDKIIKAVKKNTIILREPFMVKSLPLLRGVLPTRVFDLVAGKLFGVYKTMESFKGHSSKKGQEAQKAEEKVAEDV